MSSPPEIGQRLVAALSHLLELVASLVQLELLLLNEPEARG